MCGKRFVCMRLLRPVRRMAPEVPAAGLRGYGGDRKGTLPGSRGYAPVRSVTPLIFFQLSRDSRSVSAVFSLKRPRSAGPGNVCGLDAKKPAAGEQPASERQRRRDVLPYIFF